jgi:hypothetical protein
MKSSITPLLFAIALLPRLLPADSLSVCDRTPQIRDYLVQQAGKPCEAINDADLLQITAVRIPGAGITTLQPGDFAGLARVETVNLKRNAITELPAGIFAGLTSLRVLVLLGNDIHRLPDDFAAGNVALEKIHIFQNAFTTIPDPVLKTVAYNFLCPSTRVMTTRERT